MNVHGGLPSARLPIRTPRGLVTTATTTGLPVPVRPFAASWSLICPKISTGVESEEFRRPPVLFGCTTSSPGIDLNLG
jgi:hypothetical protein